MKEYNRNGVVYTEIEGYPKFASAFSSEKGKYSLYSVEDGTATDFFLDEVITSDKPLRSWTENYVVGRIGNNYYLVDPCGNCFHKSTQKYVICRNLFVCKEDDGKKYFNFIVNKNLEKIDCSRRGLVEVYKYALLYNFVDGKWKY